MKVFMLGWEFPPVVSGGLGVACYGLVRALTGLGADVTFLLPKPLSNDGPGGNQQPQASVQTRQVPGTSQEELQTALRSAQANGQGSQGAASSGEAPRIAVTSTYMPNPPESLQRVTFVPMDVLLQPYMTPAQYQKMVVEQYTRDAGGQWVQRAVSTSVPQPAPSDAIGSTASTSASGDGQATEKQEAASPPSQRRYLEEHATPPVHAFYAGDLFAETQRYARLAMSVAKDQKDVYDIIHAHDWMTFQAAMAVVAATGRPLVLQIHSTELDRAGANANPRIVEIERQGMQAATRVIAVSQQTKNQLVERYGIDAGKIEVVYNTADPAASPTVKTPRGHASASRNRNVLFLGRLTEQKGPHLFLQAAKKVLSVEPEIQFTIAGQGEMLDVLKDLADSLHIAENVHFTGFLNKKEREKALASADLYVMPSISEPFGIASLDALAHNVPVIISRQAGVAEVLQHVLKVDFWDTEDLANKILAVLHHAPLAETLREHGHEESRQFSWEDSAERILSLYRSLTRPRAAKSPAVSQVASSPPSPARS